MSDEQSTKDEGVRRRGAREQRSATDEGASGSLIDGLLRRAGRVAGGTFDLAVDVATATAMFGDYRLRDFLASSASPERLEAMAEAGRFLRDARETAGLSLEELAERLDLSDEAVLEGVEAGRAILPLELVLRAASLLARHDPVPFLIRFLRSYNPGLEATLEQWGVMALPRNYERERRFVNLYRQHDFLRELSDEEYQRFVDYMDASTRLVVEMMQREGAHAARSGGERRSRREPAASRAAKHKAPSGTGSRRRVGATTVAGTSDPAKQKPPPRRKPVVRKVKPRNLGS
ncbi:MAG: helix-turn-helix transcriptional regulator [Halieaceae bacterium]|jgi:transcriptional regulator with XRE-family HTH domain|nr:helix-turn-helix transcriptional regulator [Halieaceae bacterium]